MGDNTVNKKCIFRAEGALLEQFGVMMPCASKSSASCALASRSPAQNRLRAQRPIDRDEDAPVSSHVSVPDAALSAAFCPRTNKMETPERSITLCATAPVFHSLRPLRPWLLMTTRSWPRPRLLHDAFGCQPALNHLFHLTIHPIDALRHELIQIGAGFSALKLPVEQLTTLLARHEYDHAQQRDHGVVVCDCQRMGKCTAARVEPSTGARIFLNTSSSYLPKRRSVCVRTVESRPQTGETAWSLDSKTRNPIAGARQWARDARRAATIRR